MYVFPWRLSPVRVTLLEWRYVHRRCDPMSAYIACYSALTLAALGVLFARPQRFLITSTPYWRYLAAPWKLTFFVIALTGIVLIAPYTGDPTWDAIDASFMAILAFTTAPWAVGVLYQVLIARRRPWRAALVPLILWLFSASWSYDLYLLWRDGRYPVTWSSNLMASSFLYLGAGLFWNLEKHPRRGIIFGFLEPEWPEPAHNTHARHLLGYIALIALPVTLAMLSFVALEFGWL